MAKQNTKVQQKSGPSVGVGEVVFYQSDERIRLEVGLEQETHLLFFEG